MKTKTQKQKQTEKFLKAFIVACIAFFALILTGGALEPVLKHTSTMTTAEVLAVIYCAYVAFGFYIVKDL